MPANAEEPGNKMTDSAKAGTLGQADNPLYKIWTVPNLITFLRIFMIPTFFVLLLSDAPRYYAIIAFILGSCTDWIDGQIARRTNQVSHLGQALDPFVDRFLLGFGILGICLVGMLPVWIFIVLVGRDLFLLACSTWLKRKAPDAEMRVIYLGKVTTALLMTGFASIMLQWPMVPGLGLFEMAAFPGWGSVASPVGIWLVYVAIITSIITAGIYFHRGRQLIMA